MKADTRAALISIGAVLTTTGTAATCAVTGGRTTNREAVVVLAVLAVCVAVLIVGTLSTYRRNR